MSLVAYASSGESSGNESENEDCSSSRNVDQNRQDEKVVRKETNVAASSSEESLRSRIKSSLLKSIPMPKKRDAGKPVSISIPSLDDFKEEITEDEPKKKRIKSSTKSGLFSILPPPKNTSTITKQLKRPLIPHSVTKSATKSLSTQKSSHSVTNSAAKSLSTQKLSQVLKAEPPKSETSDNDDEIDSTSFFSFVDKPKAEIPVTNVDKVYQPQIEPNLENYNLLEDHKNDSSYDNTNQHFEASHSNSEDLQDYGGIEEKLNDDNTNLYKDEQFLKFMGKKKGETINFIDIHADDYRATRDEWQTKALTEEKPQSSAKNPNQPGGQTKRKHQITYLAFQAKQRELELKNTWAQNRMTRQQTQAKYGF